MVNYQKTEQAFNNEPNKYHSVKYEKRFFAMIKNPTTGNYIQYRDLAADYTTIH
jgi:hypothetical protein